MADHRSPSKNATEEAIRILQLPVEHQDHGFSATFVLVAIPLVVLLFSLLTLAIYLVKQAPSPAPKRRRRKVHHRPGKEH